MKCPECFSKYKFENFEDEWYIGYRRICDCTWYNYGVQKDLLTVQEES